MPKRRSGSAPTVATPVDQALSSDGDVKPGLDSASEGVREQGAFAFAHCAKCGWQGPGRRSRERARKDLTHHLDDKPKHADHVTVDVVQPAEA